MIPLFSRLNHDSFPFFSFSFVYLSPVSFFLCIALLESSPHILDRSPNKTINSFLFFIFQQILFLFIYLNRSESNDARIQRYTPSYRHSQSILYFILFFKDHLLLLSVYSHIRFLSMNYFHNSLTRHRIRIISFLVIAWLP